MIKKLLDFILFPFKKFLKSRTEKLTEDVEKLIRNGTGSH